MDLMFQLFIWIMAICFLVLHLLKSELKMIQLILKSELLKGNKRYINKVTIRGNTKTNDHVIIREIRTKPGQLFNRSDIIRTTRELAQLKYFNAEKIVPDINSQSNRWYC